MQTAEGEETKINAVTRENCVPKIAATRFEMRELNPVICSWDLGPEDACASSARVSRENICPMKKWSLSLCVC